MEPKIDFLGNELQVGDDVVTILSRYRELNRGKIVSMADKMITIEILHYTTTSGENKYRAWRQFPHQVVKIFNNQYVKEPNVS